MKHPGRLWPVILLSSAMALAGLDLGAQGVLAGTSGQQLALDDYNGLVYTAQVYGANQSCNFVISPVEDWPSTWLNLSGWWWQSWNGCGKNYLQIQVNGYNLYGNYLASWYLPVNEPPHNQGSVNDWTSCQIDNYVGPFCESGKDTISPST